MQFPAESQMGCPDERKQGAVDGDEKGSFFVKYRHPLARNFRHCLKRLSLIFLVHRLSESRKDASARL